MMLRSLIMAALGTGVLSAGNFFPLETGNSWTYREARSAQEFTIRVGTPALVDGQVWYALNGYAEERLLARYEGDRLLYLSPDTGGAALLTSFLPGDTWPAPARQCLQRGEAQGMRAKYDGPGGPMEGVLEIRYMTLGCADAGMLSELFAENIGMARRTIETIAGPRTFDLVSARIGSTVIETAPHARFTVSVDPAAATAEEVGLKLHLQANPPAPVTLPFTSGQEYDVEVRDQEGAEVYRWSAGRAFIFVTHSVTVSGEWSAAVSIPRPAPGSYTVQAWLTTDTGVPLYAATLPLTMESK